MPFKNRIHALNQPSGGLGQKRANSKKHSPIITNCGKMLPARVLGLRLVVGQQTLDLYAGVRIPEPQPRKFHRFDAGGILFLAARCIFSWLRRPKGSPTPGDNGRGGTPDQNEPGCDSTLPGTFRDIFGKAIHEHAAGVRYTKLRSEGLICQNSDTLIFAPIRQGRWMVMHGRKYPSKLQSSTSAKHARRQFIR